MRISSSHSTGFSNTLPRFSSPGCRRRRDRRVRDRRKAERAQQTDRRQSALKRAGRRAGDPRIQRRVKPKAAPKWLDAQFGAHLIGQAMPPIHAHDVVDRSYGRHQRDTASDKRGACV